MTLRIYVASSWRNKYQQDVVCRLRDAGFSVYDFRNPSPGNIGFHWSEIDPNWQQWTVDEFAAALKHPIAVAGFKSDIEALRNANAVVLVLPCGRSAHLEAGSHNWTYVYSPEPCEPELMYSMTQGVFSNLADIIEILHKAHIPDRPRAAQ